MEHDFEPREKSGEEVKPREEFPALQLMMLKIMQFAQGSEMLQATTIKPLGKLDQDSALRKKIKGQRRERKRIG